MTDSEFGKAVRGTFFDEPSHATSKQRFRLLDTLPALIWCTTADGEPYYMNEQYMAYSGLTLAALDEYGSTRLAGGMRAAAHPDDVADLEDRLRHCFETGEPFAMKFRHLRADGVYRWVEGRANPLLDEDGEIVEWCGVMMDVDNDTRTQQALRHAQDRLGRASQAAGLAELSASIAHEVNQPLAAIVVNGEAGLRWLISSDPDLDELRDLTESVVADARRAAKIVARVRTMATRRAPEYEQLSFDQVVRETLLFLRHETRSRGVTILHREAPDAPQVLGDQTQLQQVIVNLVVNAMQAMAQANIDHRKIVISTTTTDPANLQCRVEDSGPGVQLDHLSQLFENFFTTTEGGMGMGLPICRSIVEAHGGRITVENDSADGGARFSFTLPTV